MVQKQELSEGKEKDQESVIRPATIEDMPQVAQLLFTVYHEALQKYGTHFSLTDETLENIEQHLTDDFKRKNPVWVAQKANEIVGTISLFTSTENKSTEDPEYMQRPTVAEVAHFAIKSDHQGTGLGRKMLETVEQAAKQSGMEGLALVTVKDSVLESYYRNHGFALGLGDVKMEHHVGIALGKVLKPTF